jgi:hypothetical protein
MTKDEALLLALDAFEEIAWSNDTKWQSDRAKVALNTFKEILVEPEEKPHPVHIGVDVTTEGTAVTAFYRKPDAVVEMFYAKFHPLKQPEQPQVRTGNCLRVGVCASEGHKIQPQRTWVRLTDEDISEIVRGTHNTGSFVRAIEAKLKEKNT